MSLQQRLLILDTAEQVAQRAASEFVELAHEVIRNRGRFSVALSGGNTPRRMYAHLASEEFARNLEWSKVHFFWSDERCVPPTHSDSNYRMANEALLDKIQAPDANIYRMSAEREDLEQAAAEYENTLRKFFAVPEGVMPQFDLVMLGMGADGHTASLFPNSQALKETSKLVVANYVEKFSAYRMTMTFPTLNASAHVFFLVTGADKANVLSQVLQPRPRSEPLPARLIQPANGVVTWLIDQEAATRLRY